MKQFYNTCKTIIIGFLLVAIITTILYFVLATKLGTTIAFICMIMYISYTIGSVVLSRNKKRKEK